METISLGDLLVSPGIYVLGVAIYFLTRLIRRIVENIWPSLNDVKNPVPGQVLIEGKYPTTMSLWWNTVILYALGPAIGTASGYAPIPFVYGELKGDGRALVGLVVGFCCALLFKIVKRGYEQRAGKVSAREVS
jgi:hypothetical protein